MKTGSTTVQVKFSDRKIMKYLISDGCQIVIRSKEWASSRICDEILAILRVVTRKPVYERSVKNDKMHIPLIE